KYYNIRDYCGWTIRTVKVVGAPWKNLYVNWLPKRQVPAKINELQKKLKGKALFVIYPSWKWKKGGTVLIERNRTVIESARGSIVDLMRYGKVDASYFYEQGKLISSSGKKKLLSPAERKKILQAERKIKEKEIILEWGITTQNKFIFYRIETLKDAAKLLIKKYS
ncbi:hypothetical protein KKB10_05350, partial [Patescibacteria group bacterium]|nr:hypothetical protein [Patescibacteria group bacterium]